MSIPTIAVHGGSGVLPKSIQNPEVSDKYHHALAQALDEGFEVLDTGGSALKAVSQAVGRLENCALYNAGKGAVFNAKGEHELDAAIMEGRELQAGAVAGINSVKNPILLAKYILENSPYVFLAGEEAVDLARREGFECMSSDYFFSQQRYDQWQEVRGSEKVKLDHSSTHNQPMGTVGCVAVDENGHVAAATSTGGMTNKAWGRIGDSPLIGAGTYANNQTCAISCTGYGEYFIRSVAAYDVSCRMQYDGMSLQEAADAVIHTTIKNMGGTGGLIAVDAQGNIALPFNTEGMYRGMKNADTQTTAIQ